MDFVDTKSQQILVKINLPARKKDKNKHNQPGNKRVKSGFFVERFVGYSWRNDNEPDGNETENVFPIYK